MEDRDFSLQHFRFHLEPKAPLHMPAYNKGNVIRGGFGSTFRRIVCHGNCREPGLSRIKSQGRKQMIARLERVIVHEEEHYDESL